MGRSFNIRMDDDEELAVFCFPERHEAVLLVAVILIEPRPRQRIKEYRHGRFERNPMLREIDSRLGWIPVELVASCSQGRDAFL